MKSRRKSADQILGILSRAEAENLLCDIANLPPMFGVAPTGDKVVKATARILRKYSDIFEPMQKSAVISAKSGVLPPGTFFGLADALGVGEESKSEALLTNSINTVRIYLCKAWDATDARQRDWYLFKLRDNYWTDVTIAEMGELTDIPHRFFFTPPITPLEAAMFYFQRASTKALHCPNPICPAPYFFARRKNQKYCSDACAVPAQRAAKREWWHRHKGEK